MQRSGFFRECIFLGPKGLNTDVIAHELVHAEVRHRTNLFVELEFDGPYLVPFHLYSHILSYFRDNFCYNPRNFFKLLIWPLVL